MLELGTLNGPHGIPIYFQRMPEFVRAVSMAWVIFVGAGDDESVSEHGAYHWFEHLTLNGTKKYPKGNSQIRIPITRLGGRIGALTCKTHTKFHVKVPVRAWREGLSMITELWSQPLNSLEAAKHEREIIRQEIVRSNSDAERLSEAVIPELLWPGHPYGHRTLGSEASLDKIDLSALPIIYRAGYDRSRAVLFVIGNIDPNELQAEVAKLADTMPDNGLSERRRPVCEVPLPVWNKNGLNQIETNFSSSIIEIVFPLPFHSAWRAPACLQRRCIGHVSPWRRLLRLQD